MVFHSLVFCLQFEQDVTIVNEQMYSFDFGERIALKSVWAIEENIFGLIFSVYLSVI